MVKEVSLVQLVTRENQEFKVCLVYQAKREIVAIKEMLALKEVMDLGE